MSMASTSGDIALSARPATAEAFQPFGRLVGAGERARLGKKGGVVIALEEAKPGPRRVTHLSRFPDARRLVVPLGDAPLLVVVLAAGDRPGGPPAAFQTPAGTGVLIEAGVWHAGPTPLGEVALLEALETTGPADRLDRKSVQELLGSEGLRILLPEEPGAPGAFLDLATPGSVALAANLEGRLRLGCLLLDGLTLRTDDPRIREEEDRLREALQGMWGRAVDLKQVPGIQELREMHRDLGLRPEHVPPGPEALLARALTDEPFERHNSLVDALRLCALRVRVPMSVYDAARLGDRIVARLGGPGEAFSPAEREGRSLEGKPVLCDRSGPFGGIAGDAARARPGPRTSRALVAVWFPPRVGDPAAHALLEEVSRSLRAVCEGAETGRTIAG